MVLFHIDLVAHMQLVHALDDWTSSLDKGFATDVIYFDFSKAFDSVPHVRLINKLKAYGVDGPLLKWFLVGRRQMCSYKWYFIFLDTGQKRCPSGLHTWSIIILIIILCK